MNMKHLFNAAAIAAVLFGSTASAETVDMEMERRINGGNEYYWMELMDSSQESSRELMDAGFNGVFSSTWSSDSNSIAWSSISLVQSRDPYWDGVFDLQNTIVHYEDGSEASLAQIAGSLDAGDPDNYVRVSSTWLGEANALDARWFSNSRFTSITIAWNNGPTPAVPEPETWAMLLAGLGVIGSVARRRRA